MEDMESDLRTMESYMMGTVLYTCGNLPARLRGKHLYWDVRYNLVLLVENGAVFVVAAANDPGKRLRNLTEEEEYVIDYLEESVENFYQDHHIYRSRTHDIVLKAVVVGGKKRMVYCEYYGITTTYWNSDQFSQRNMFWLPESHLIVVFDWNEEKDKCDTLLVGAADSTGDKLRAVTRQEEQCYISLVNLGVIDGNHSHSFAYKVNVPPPIPEVIFPPIDKYRLVPRPYKNWEEERKFWLTQKFVCTTEKELGYPDKVIVIGAADNHQSDIRRLTYDEFMLLREMEQMGKVVREDNPYTRE